VSANPGGYECTEDAELSLPDSTHNLQCQTQGQLLEMEMLYPVRENKLKRKNTHMRITYGSVLLSMHIIQTHTSYNERFNCSHGTTRVLSTSWILSPGAFRI
jgi:hypothetical protein